MDVPNVPCRKPHLVLRVILAVVVFITVIVTIVAIAGAGGEDKWLGKWLDIPDNEYGDYICSASLTTCPSATTPGAWTRFENKCWYSGGTMARSRVDAQSKCRAMSSSANLAEIDNAAQDAYAFGLCSKVDKWCFFGLLGSGDSAKPANWAWISGSTSTYRNWWSTDQHDEPTGDGEHTISWMTTVFRDEVMQGYFFLFIFIIVYLLLVITCCSMNGAFIYCGLKNTNKCCVISGASLDGVISGILVLFAVGGVMQGDIPAVMTNLILAGLFLAGSIMGCCQCGAVGQQQAMPQSAPPVVGGMVVGQAVEIGGDANKATGSV